MIRLKYKYHYITRYEGSKLVECWRLDSNDVLALLLPKFRKQYHSVMPVKIHDSALHSMPKKSDSLANVLYSKRKNDECYTPAYAVTPIIKYIPKNAVVWCPFDTADSEFVKQISHTHSVVRSHLDDGQDFFTYEPFHWDVIVSNPPFTNKRKFFERALSFTKPFALIMANTLMLLLNNCSRIKTCNCLCSTNVWSFNNQMVR